jgi:hypothetical protein
MFYVFDIVFFKVSFVGEPGLDMGGLTKVIFNILKEP